jgi:phosphoribosyl-AMP cyclohydrolase
MRQCPLLSDMGQNIETGTALTPRYGADGLITAVVTDAASGAVLMLAHMNADALAATLASGDATFWSRSRKALWRKGETSGNVLKVKDIRIDCDQDALWLIAEPQGPACHTGAASCFYRRIAADGALEPVE